MPHFAWYTGLPTKDETSQVTIYRMHTVCFFIFIQLQTIVSFFVKSLNKSPKDCIKMWSNLGIVISKKFSFVFTVSFVVGNPVVWMYCTVYTVHCTTCCKLQYLKWTGVYNWKIKRFSQVKILFYVFIFILHSLCPRMKVFVCVCVGLDGEQIYG